jgi:hypothetical protein
VRFRREREVCKASLVRRISGTYASFVFYVLFAIEAGGTDQYGGVSIPGSGPAENNGTVNITEL